jgi:signal peptidase I
MSKNLSLLLIAALVLSLLAATALVLTSPYRLYVVKTGSMTPTIPAASVVVVNPHQLPRPNQIATFQHKGNVVTHRFLRTNRNGTLVTKGHANRTPDQWKLTRANLVGTVKYHLPLVGWLLIYLRQPTGFLSLLLLPFLLRLAWQLGGPSIGSRERIGIRVGP